MKYVLAHYYGNIVRYLFLAGAVLMVITLPQFEQFLHLPLIASIISIAILVVAAGLTNPKQYSSAILNFGVSFIAFIVFAYAAVKAYQDPIAPDKYLLTTIALAVIFLFALYFSMKTVRAEMLTDTPPIVPVVPEDDEEINL